MRLLLDTHALLWWITDDDQLSEKAGEAIADGANDVYLSAASAWEIAIKAGLGRIRLPGDAWTFTPDQLERNAFQALPVHVAHAVAVITLPDVHRDPFDRMLVAQAMTEGLTIVSGDQDLSRYPVPVVW
ncbi:MAG: type II toxin-antitoxin system VapC family toxin [Actinomycetota bacterium]